MPLQYRLTKPVREVLARWNYLGFDTAEACAQAIIQSPDWQHTWDLSDADAQDIQDVNNWRNMVWAKNQGDIFGQLGDAFKL